MQWGTRYRRGRKLWTKRTSSRPLSFNFIFISFFETRRQDRILPPYVYLSPDVGFRSKYPTQPVVGRAACRRYRLCHLRRYFVEIRTSTTGTLSLSLRIEAMPGDFPFRWRMATQWGRAKVVSLRSEANRISSSINSSVIMQSKNVRVFNESEDDGFEIKAERRRDKLVSHQQIDHSLSESIFAFPAVVISMDRSPENTAPNHCLHFDGIVARHPGTAALSGSYADPKRVGNLVLPFDVWPVGSSSTTG
jgi:hypothetical protein